VKTPTVSHGASNGDYTVRAVVFTRATQLPVRWTRLDRAGLGYFGISFAASLAALA
jgi:hypothetical protein